LRLARPKLPGRSLDPRGNPGARGMIAGRSREGPVTGSGLQAHSADASIPMHGAVARFLGRK